MNQKLKTAILPKHAVGREIITKVPTITSEKTVEQVKELLPEFAQKTDSINYIYVVNNQDKLVGVISIKELIQHSSETKIKDVMIKDLVVSHPQVDRERVAYLAIKHNIKAIPIVDKENHMLGVLPSDKILTIVYKEYKEDIYRSAGIILPVKVFGTILDQGVWKSFIARIPWIVVGLIGGIFGARIVGFFEGTLSNNIVLAAFMPLIVYISDAVGTQTQTLFVRDVAFNPKLTIVSYTLKQVATSTLIGLICGGLVWVLVNVFWSSAFLGIVIGLATFTAISSSTLIAVFIPYLLCQLKQDPAIGSGPFATILQDLLSIYIYFLIASALL